MLAFFSRLFGKRGSQSPDDEPRVDLFPASPEPLDVVIPPELTVSNVVQLDPPDNRLHRIHPQTMALVEEMKSYAGFVEIMQHHLSNVCTETQSAAEDILGQALDIEGSVTSLVRHVSDTMQSDALMDASDTLQLSVSTGRSVIADLIRNHSETQAEIRHSLSTVRALSHRMRAHLDEIEDIRRYTDLLAINARIRIASLGSNTGLDVIAEEIRALATQTGSLANNLNVELTEMDRLVGEDLLNKVSSQKHSDDAKAKALQDSFEKLSSHMALLNQFQAELIGQVQQRGEEMRTPLNTLCGSIQFQDVARQQLEQVSRALSMISDHFVSLSNAIIHDDAPPDSSIANCLASILENYVMEQQRAAHRGEAAATAPKIELF